MPKIFVIHENDAWTAPLQRELAARGLPHDDWFLNEGKLDLSRPPPEGVFYNRMSASSHTRDHRYAPEYTAAVLAWLESHGRLVINSSRALQLEISKVAQYATLEAYGVRTPRTIAVVGKRDLLAAAKSFAGPFITKHNRAGKGLGVRLFQNTKELRAYVESGEFQEPVDGITLIQQYIRSPESSITRCEFVGGEFLYAVRVDTSDGFLLCPADECQDEAAYCPAEPTSKFEIIEGFDDPILDSYRRVLAANGIHIAGIEFIVDEHGTKYTYDINTNTNYNTTAEARTGQSGMATIADYLGEQLRETGWMESSLPRAAAR